MTNGVWIHAGCSWRAAARLQHALTLCHCTSPAAGAAHTDPMSAFPHIKKAIMDNYRRCD